MTIQAEDSHDLYKDCLLEEHFVSKEKITCKHCKTLAASTYREQRAHWLKREAQSIADSIDSDLVMDQVSSPALSHSQPSV